MAISGNGVGDAALATRVMGAISYRAINIRRATEEFSQLDVGYDSPLGCAGCGCHVGHHAL